MNNPSRPKRTPIQPDWFTKTLAGLILGFIFAIGCSDLFMNLADDTALNARVQIAMWMVFPIWLTWFGLAFAFRKGLHAWLALGGLNVLIFSFIKLS